MDIEFHYWITGIIAHAAGFTEDEAKIIAYCSQYVDDNDVSMKIKDKTSKKEYVNFISQTMNILKPKPELMRIYPIFHFVPGDPVAPSAKRRDGKMHLFNATPNNEFANELLHDAFTSEEKFRLYRIGVATHAFADTWAHQNFTGWHDNFNVLGANLIPNIGHADALHKPDWVGLRWTDKRLVEGEINNNHRFLSAAEAIFLHYCDYLSSEGRYGEEGRPRWDDLQQKLVEAMGPVWGGDENSGREERIARYGKLAPWLSAFDEMDWFNEAIETDVRGFRDAHDGLLSHLTIFKDVHYWRTDVDPTTTHWRRFQTAVKQHEQFALGLLSPHFEQIGIDLSKA
jgi:hypothetical protein